MVEKCECRKAVCEATSTGHTRTLKDEYHQLTDTKIDLGISIRLCKFRLNNAHIHYQNSLEQNPPKEKPEKTEEQPRVKKKRVHHHIPRQSTDIIKRTDIHKKYCYACDRFSCEYVTLKTEEQEYIEDPDHRFQFIKDRFGTIYDGGIVDRCIDNCEHKNKPVLYSPPLPRIWRHGVSRIDYDKIEARRKTKR